MGCVFLAIAVVEIVDDFLENVEPPHFRFREELAVSEEGSPMILRRQTQPFGKLETFDLDHQPIEMPVDKPQVIQASLSEEPPRPGHWLRMLSPAHGFSGSERLAETARIGFLCLTATAATGFTCKV